MPKIYKTLADITVWILFVLGCLAILTQLPIPRVFGGGSWQYLAVGIASLVLSVLTMKLRKTLN